MKDTLQRTTFAAMLAAIVCIATLLIQIPSPFKGYLNLGDGIVLLCGWLLPLPYSALAAALGAMLADALAGYIVYAPATFVIKGLMAWIACTIFHWLNRRFSRRAARLLSGGTAELAMVLGYFSFEAFLYGAPMAALNIPMNLLQGLLGTALAALLIRFIKR